jgi:topoisomerase-4 subunit A
MTDGPKELSLFGDLEPVAEQPESTLRLRPRRARSGLEAQERSAQAADERQFSQYRYVIRDRAIPDLDDGLKPVQAASCFRCSRMTDRQIHQGRQHRRLLHAVHPARRASIGEAL